MKLTNHLWLVIAIEILLTSKAVSAEVEWSIRLRDGISPLEGRVEVYLEGRWGTVMDSHWDLQDATVVCQQLGFSTAKAALMGLVVSLQSHITSVQCHGQETSLAHCNFTNLSVDRDQTNQQRFTAAGVHCAVEYSLQVVDGHLEILDQGGAWRRVCSDDWSQDDAMVACRQLGYQQLVNTSYGILAQSSLSVVAVASTDCSRDEFHLQSCTSFQFQHYNSCTSGQNVILSCVGVPKVPHAVHAHNASCSTLNLSWRVPDDRGSPVTGYWIQYKQSASTIWSEMKISSSSTDPLQIEARLENLVPATLYEIQVNAGNEVGNSSFSEILYTWTTSRDVQPPVPGIFAVQHNNMSTSITSALIHWNISDQCDDRVVGYEILYYQLKNLPNNETVFFAPDISSDQTQISYTLHHLKPYTEYSVQIRTMLQISGGSQRLVSDFSEPQVFMTPEAAPSGSPQSFTGYLSHLHNSAKFRWGAVDERESNGLVIGYNFSCNYSRDGSSEVVNRNFDNATFQFELDIAGSAVYECAIAASTSAGRGPNSAPVYFTTPGNVEELNGPRPPFNVGYEVIQMDADRENFLVQAMWSINECQFNFSCFEVLGYIIECRNVRRSGDVIRKIIWRDELQTDQYNSTRVNFSAKPYRTYACAMASINGYGTGIFGSRIDVDIPQRGPVQSPMHLYASKIQARIVTINWRYNENPPVGDLVGFYISYYLYDERYPNQNGAPIRENLFHEVSNQNRIDFSYVLDEHLSPGGRYNVYVAAITDTSEGGGPGPQASMSVTTLRTAPAIRPSFLQNSRDSLRDPPRLTFSWEYITNIDADSILLGGFILHCYSNVSNSTTDLYSHVHFVNRAERSLEQFSVTLTQHVTCASQISNFYMCDIRAFNEIGQGPRSTSTLVYLSCNSESGGLQDTFLADPYVGVVLLVLVLLLIAVVCILGIMLCYYIRQNYLSQRIIAGKYDSYTTAEAYDEGYINMAPSGASAKPFAHNGRNGNLPPPPGVNLPAMGESSDDPYNHYDWIPADRNSKGDNDYDEINLQGARMLSAARARQASNSNATQNTVEMSSVRNHEQSSEIEESQMTTLTLVTSQGPAAPSSDITDEKLNELHRAFSISPSHSTDYIEMSGATTGKKMGKAERNLLERSATSLSSHSSIGGTPKRAKYNPYHYDSVAPNSTAHQVETMDQDRSNTTTSTTVRKKSDTGTQESTSSGAAAQSTLGAANNPAGAGMAGNSSSAGTTTERLCNGKDEGGKDSRKEEKQSQSLPDKMQN